MSKYEVVATHVIDDFFWCVYENSSKQVIETFLFEDDAFEMADFMENGGAFNGFTPLFVTSKVNLPKEDVNRSFTRYFSD